MSKYFVLGYFGLRTNQLDGQTVKTRDLYKLVEQQYTDVAYYDTQEFKFKKLSIIKMFLEVIKCKTLVYLPAHNNLKYIFPLLYILSLIFRFDIQYYVVGGWLREYIENMPVHRFMLSRISGIHVETLTLQNELKDYFNYKNVDIFPNFRFFDFEPTRDTSEKLRIVFMARINMMKGLDWILEFANYVHSHNLGDKYIVTFYGPINNADRDFFNNMVKLFPFIEYKGILQPYEIYDALSQHDILILPTHYYTEGLPGSIVDAYISGLPVVVTKWKHAHEFVEDGHTGFIVPFENGVKEFIERLQLLESNRELLYTLQCNVLEKRLEFAPPIINL